MVLKLLVKLSSLILGRAYSDDEPRADLYLPVWVLAFCVVLAALGIAAAIYSIAARSVLAGVAAILCLGLGAAALLCWRNQTIRMLPDDSFEYTTFLGNKKVYRFCEITQARANRDSTTLIARGERIHIEASAIMSQRLADRLNEIFSDED